MNNLFLVCNQWLGKRMFLIVLIALILGFFVHLSDSSVLRIVIITLFAYMTLVTAMETSLKEFIKVMKDPRVPLWVLFLVHIVTPLIALIAGYLFFPDDSNTRLGYLIGASIPVGVTSIIWTSLVHGNVAVSLVTVTLDTLIVPFFLPLFFMVIVGQAIQIDYMQMTMQLLWMITIPSVIGMVLHDGMQGKTQTFCKGFGGCTAKAAFFFVIFINAALVAPVIHWNIGICKILLVTLFMVTAGYLIGYMGSFAVKDHSQEITLAMIYNVGLRNISSGLVLALAYFPASVAVPITLYMLYQQPMATLVPYVMKLRQRISE